MSAADCGLSDDAGAGLVDDGVTSAAGADVPSTLCGSPGGEKGLLLKLYANGFLQRAKGAQFFGCHQRQGAPG